MARMSKEFEVKLQSVHFIKTNTYTRRILHFKNRKNAMLLLTTYIAGEIVWWQIEFVFIE